MLHTLINFIVDTVSQLGYAGIVVMMFLESSFFPFPSEVVMVPAGYLAAQGEMNFIAVILCGIIGSILGAWLNYYLAIKLGKPLLHKFGKWLFLTEEKLVKVEKYFSKHGEISTFVGRLLPVIRQYISFPAGLSRMNLAVFSFYTGLGAGIWVTILTIIGYLVGENQQLVSQYTHDVLIAVVSACTLISVVYIVYNKRKSRFAPQEIREGTE